MADDLPYGGASAPPFAEAESRRIEAAIQPPSDELADAVATPVSPLRQAARRFARNRLAVASLIVLVVLLVTPCIAPWLPLIDPTVPDAANTDAWPGGQHLLGKDSNGHDLFSAMIYGLRPPFIVGLIGSAVTTVLGVTIGLSPGFRGGGGHTVFSHVTHFIFAL